MKIMVYGLILLILCVPSVVADDWDSELAASLDSLDVVDVPAGSSDEPLEARKPDVDNIAANTPPVDIRVTNSRARIDSRMDNLERRVRTLEQTLRSMDKSLRNLDRKVGDLKRRR